MKAGFIGTGNMGGALALAVSKAIGGENTLIFDRHPEKLQNIHEKCGAAVGTFEYVCRNANYLFVGVKPQVFDETSEKIGKVVKDSTVIVSMAAGIDINHLKSLFPNNKIIRIMPNMPVSVGEGVTLYCSENGENEPEFEEMMKYSGLVTVMKEGLIDAGSALTGCGPAFVYTFIDALADGAVRCGIPRAKALEFAAMTLIGSAKTMLETGEHPGRLKDAVCSPKGSTIEGIRALEDGSFRSTVINAVVSAYERTKELGK